MTENYLLCVSEIQSISAKTRIIISHILCLFLYTVIKASMINNANCVVVFVKIQNKCLGRDCHLEFKHLNRSFKRKLF